MTSSPSLVSCICSFLVVALALPTIHASRAAIRSSLVNSPTSFSDIPSALSNLPLHTPAINLTSHNNISLGVDVPQCWSEEIHPGPVAIPIQDPSDCYDAILLIVEDEGPDDPVRWFASRIWYFGTCAIHLRLRPRSPGTEDTFTRGEITRHALVLQITCVDQAHNYLGGRIPIGRGIFEVMVFGDRPMELSQNGTNVKAISKRDPGGRGVSDVGSVYPDLKALRDSSSLVAKREIPLRLPSLSEFSPSSVSSTKASPKVLPTCYAPSSSYPPISRPQDCLHTIQKITESAPYYPETWTEPTGWIYGSCAVWVTLLDFPEREGDEDVFSRIDVEVRAKEVWSVCVGELEGWRGGWVSVGEKGIFAVSVEALQSAEIQKGQS